MKKGVIIGIAFLLVTCGVFAQPKQFELNDAWIKKIETLAPDKATVEVKKPRKVLVFSLITGFNHWVTPHTAQVIKILGQKTGAYNVILSNDIYQFEKKNLKKYDAIVLNNNCSTRPKRDLFWDELDKNSSLSKTEKLEKAAELESNLINYVNKGGGLMVVHGGIVMQNNSMAFSEMCGGSFDYHPKQQQVTLELVDPDHPLVKAFNRQPFVHVDEPYLFNKAYAQKNFRPLLYIDAEKLQHTKPFEPEKKYVSWIKKHGKGRVFYVSPSHNAQSFENERMLKFFLDGAQYILGDLKCDDTPINLK